MSIPSIPSLQSVSRGQSSRHPSVGSLNRGRDNTLYELTRTQVQLTKRNSFADISHTKNNISTSRQEIKKEGTIPSLIKPMIARSLSVVNGMESKPKIVKSFTYNELGRDTVAEKKEKQGKKFALWQKINEIKNSLLRSSESEEQKIFPQKSSLRRVFECFEIMNETESNLSELMTLVVSTLKSAIYGNSRMTDSLVHLSILTENDELKNLAADLGNNNVTYYSLVTALFKELIKQTAPKLDVNQDDKIRIQELEKLVEDRDQTIEALETELENRITPQEHQRLLSEIDGLRKRLHKLQTDHTKLLTQHEDIKTENGNMKRTIADDVDQIEALSCKNSDLECDKENLQIEVEKYVKKIFELQQSFNPIKDFKDKTIMKLSHVKNQIIDLRKENEQLSNENRELNVRAACGFENLTPRPNYKKLPVWGDVERCIYAKSGNIQRYSTAQIVENLTNKIMGVEEVVVPVPEQKEQKENKVLKKSRSKKRVDAKESPIVPPLKSLPLKVQTRTVTSMTERKHSSNVITSKTTANTVNDDSNTKRDPVSTLFTAKTIGDEERKASLASGRNNNLSIHNESQDEKDMWEEDAVDITNDLLDYLAKTNKTLEKASQKV